MVNGKRILPLSINHLPFTIYELLLVLVHVHVLGVDDVVVAASGGGRAAARARRSARRVGLLLAARRRARAAALVERLGQLVRGGLEVREGVVETVGPALFERLLRVGNRRLDLRLRRAVELLLVLLEGL